MEKKEKEKREAALAAAKYIEDGMIVSLGTGSTSYFLIQETGAMIRAGRKLRAVATSMATEKFARSLNIPIIRPEEVSHVDLAVDGVDEIDGSFRAVKGGGGALLREKIAACKAEQVIWIMDESKLVKQLGTVPLPAEVLPFGAAWAANAISRLGGNAVLRQQEGKPFVTDNGNWILDVRLPENIDYQTAAETVRQIPGVLETGFFDRICSRIIIGGDGGVRELINPHKQFGQRQFR